MSKKEEFLRDLEDLCRRYDVNKGEVDIYISVDGGEDVIEIDMPSLSYSGKDVTWQSFILPLRPYDGRRE